MIKVDHCTMIRLWPEGAHQELHAHPSRTIEIAGELKQTQTFIAISEQYRAKNSLVGRRLAGARSL